MWQRTRPAVKQQRYEITNGTLHFLSRTRDVACCPHIVCSVLLNGLFCNQITLRVILRTSGAKQTDRLFCPFLCFLDGNREVQHRSQLSDEVMWGDEETLFCRSGNPCYYFNLSFEQLQGWMASLLFWWCPDCPLQLFVTSSPHPVLQHIFQRGRLLILHQVSSEVDR